MKKKTTKETELKLPEISGPKKQTARDLRLLWVLMAIVLVIVLMVIKNPKLLVAATVNNKPIMVWNLNSVLQKKFGSKILDQMIDEMLIKEEAKRLNVTVSNAEVQNKMTELENQVGGKDALGQLLLRQGMTNTDLSEQLSLKTLVDKMLVNKVKVTDKDVQDFIEKNKESLPATDAAEQKKYVESIITQQQLSDSFQKWYEELKSKTKVYKFF
jgi:foldase protein PrsA